MAAAQDSSPRYAEFIPMGEPDRPLAMLGVHLRTSPKYAEEFIESGMQDPDKRLRFEGSQYDPAQIFERRRWPGLGRPAPVRSQGPSIGTDQIKNVSLERYRGLVSIEPCAHVVAPQIPPPLPSKAFESLQRRNA